MIASRFRSLCSIACALLVGLTPLKSSVAMLTEGQASAGFHAKCNRQLGAHNTQIKIHHAPVTYNFNLSIKQLKAIVAKEAPSATQTNPTLNTLGLTLIESGYRIESEFSTMSDSSNGQQCARIDLSITLLSELHQVYVAKRFTPGTCGHEHILTHEQEHVRINEEHLREVAKQVGQYIKTQLPTAPIVFPAHRSAEQQLSRWINVRLGPSIRKALDEVQYKHWRIDTPSEYAKSQYVCEGEIARLLNKD